MCRYQFTFHCLSLWIFSVDCLVLDLIPVIVRPQFESALKAVKDLSQTETIEDIDIHGIPYGKELTCVACRLTVEFFLTAHNFYVPEHVIKTGLVNLCSLLQTRLVCQGIIELNVTINAVHKMSFQQLIQRDTVMPIFIEIAKRKPDLRAEHVCGTVLEQYCTINPIVDWYIDIPDRVQTPPAKQYILSQRTNYERETEEVIEIAHVTDTHIDEKYTPGARARDCKEPICCRDYQGQATSSADSAGLWGNYISCDIPWSTADNLLNTLSANHKKTKYLYMTGDLIAHNIWETSREENIKQIREQASLFYNILGDDVKIFPVLGNHEPHPANVLAPPGIEGYSGEWLYEAFYDAWCKHFPQETKSSFMKGGYYSVTPAPGFRIIGLNSMFSYVFNWWMILDPVDPAGQLKWLTQTLLHAEARGEKVHILIHGPPIETDTLQVWKREYNKLIHRFKSTVAGQFMGHTHRDQFYVHYAPQNTQPVAVAWNGGSVTTFTNVNPNYRIYSINKRNLEVQDFDTYTYNLTEANQTPNKSPKWFKLYSFKQAYNVASLTPQDIDSLVKKMAHDGKIFSKYIIFKSTVDGQFMGHTHRDQFYVHYAPQTTQPVAVSWNGGIFTMFTNVNPNYRIYSINNSSM